MRYYVIGDDGSKYGPAEVQTLNQWIQEGRLTPTTLLEEEASGTRIAAAAVQALTFPPAAAPAPPGSPAQAAPNAGPYAGRAEPTTGPYAKGAYTGGPVDNGNGLIIASWIFTGLGFVVCCCFGWVLSGVGTVLAIVANGKGNPKAKAPLICGIIAVLLGIILQFAVLPMMGKSVLDILSHQPAPANMTPAQKAQFEQSQKNLQQQLDRMKTGAPTTGQ